ncbi:hypothetical protein B6I21_04695 [candidate division KSB1 bacterium 4572_119]|nr:MAG: hypothetical protein B6I21_04695 [candidate division KSB1 bacterium 4572_119]
MSEAVIKIILISTLFFAIIIYYLLPRSKFARKLKLGVFMFKLTNIIGIICGIVGLFTVFILQEKIIIQHLWELTVLPYALVWFYWLIMIRIKKTSNIFDEKQEFNMAKAGALTMAGSILALAIMFNLSYNDVFQLNYGLWFPFYLFSSITQFSFFTLFLFKKE